MWADALQSCHSCELLSPRTACWDVCAACGTVPAGKDEFWSPECLCKSQELNWMHKVSRGVLTCKDLEMVLICELVSLHTSKQEQFHPVETAVERLQGSCFVIGVLVLSAFSSTSMRRPLQFLAVSASVSYEVSEVALWMMLSFFSLLNVSL